MVRRYPQSDPWPYHLGVSVLMGGIFYVGFTGLLRTNKKLAIFAVPLGLFALQNLDIAQDGFRHRKE
ncbi:unnamed protein product [Blepharisma stoltei]|uniref:Uncharacterized protein n=1 Tax=Blepharisma stoltei TaxID=1481888 RepID=A0AAU9IDR2_9CILI|nr:unnamed protein product [Blepharisma stoltei]